jgi:dipeptidase
MCDTFVALPPTTAGGSIIFGKNSDREPNEAQALEFHPAATHLPDATVACTYIEIPQVRETLPVLLSRPFWMWGAEMGANSAGVVIGNEAVFTRMPLDRKGGLTGMDLLRLALERSDDAPAAVDWITRLLADHGQGGICGYQDKKMAYHNSFLIADPRTAWVLETAGPLWAAREVKNYCAISNGLTIGEEFDRSHPDLVATAREKGWLKKGVTFNFATCYSDWFFTTFSACRRRQSRAAELLERQAGSLNLSKAFGILRDHGEAPYRPASHFLGNRICAHAANPLARNATQTTGSLVAELTPDSQTYWASGTAAPCTSVFKPIRIGRQTLPDLGPAPGPTYDPANLWWRHEKLHRALLVDFSAGRSRIEQAQQALEAIWLKRATQMAPETFYNLTREAFQQASDALPDWIEKVKPVSSSSISGWIYRTYWTKQNRAAQIPG